MSDSVPRLSSRTKRGRVLAPIAIAARTVDVGCLQTLLERGHRDDGFDSPLIVVLAVFETIGVVGLGISELTNDEPVIDFHVLRNRTFAPGCAFTAARLADSASHAGEVQRDRVIAACPDVPTTEASCHRECGTVPETAPKGQQRQYAGTLLALLDPGSRRSGAGSQGHTRHDEKRKHDRA